MACRIFRTADQHDLAAVDLPVRKQLTARGKRIDDVYFLEAGIASVVSGGNAKQIEIGIIGREGMTGLAVALGVERALHDTFMQIAGKGLRVSAAKLRELNDQSRTLHRSLLVYVHAYLMQIAQTALANGLGKIEERLARWLLMAADRLDTNELPLTHEFLAATLGTQRPGVTIALHELESGPDRDAARQDHHPGPQGAREKLERHLPHTRALSAECNAAGRPSLTGAVRLA